MAGGLYSLRQTDQQQAQAAGSTAAALEASQNTLASQARQAEKQQRISGTLQGAAMGAQLGLMTGNPVLAGIGAGVGALGGLISTKLF